MQSSLSKKVILLIRKTVFVFIAAVLCILLHGCSKGMELKQPIDGESVTVEKEPTPDINDVTVQDNDLIYLDDDDDSIVTMYLTVRQGNNAENTDHTWKSLNDYSIFHYERLGIERYKVEAIMQVGNENGPIAGELGYGLRIPNAIVQIRGATTSEAPQKSYKIMLKENAGEWRQQRTIALNKHVYDGTRFKNKLCYDLIKQIPNMISLRTQFVHLYVKDETEDAETKFVDYGLFTQVEQPNTRYLKNHGLDSGGQLYKLNFFEYYRYADSIKLKTDPTYDAEKFEQLLEIKGDDNNTKLIGMLEDVNDFEKPIEEIFEKHFDAENYFTWMAFNILVGNIDTQSRNYYLYSPLNSNKWYFILWDLDGSFKHTSDVLNGLLDNGYEIGISNYWANVVHNRVLRVPQYREILDQKMQQLREILTVEKINTIAQSYRQATERYVYAMPDNMYARLTPDEYYQVIDKLPREIELNYNLYLESLKRPMPFYLDVPFKKDGVLTFQWDVAFDLNGQDISYSFELAKDYTFKEPIYSQDNLTFPIITTQLLEPGQYFFRVFATNEDGEKQPAMAYYKEDIIKHFGIQCFYVLANGEVVSNSEQQNP